LGRLHEESLALPAYARLLSWGGTIVCGCRQAEKRRQERELERQEREREVQKQRQAELERKAVERREIERLSKSFAITLEGSLVLDIPPEVRPFFGHASIVHAYLFTVYS